MPKRRHFQKDGQGLVEFALVLTLFLLLAFGVLDLARIFHVSVVMANASREGARHGVYYSQEGEAGAISAARDEIEAGGLDSDEFGILANCDDPAGSCQAGEIEVTVETLLLVTQADHAHFSGELLSLWRADGLPDNPRREEVLFAAREHDNGWREADAAPLCDPVAGRPVDFIGVPRELRIELWQRGTARFAGSHPYAARLIVRHAATLHRDRRGVAEWNDFLGFLDELERGLAEETGTGAADLAADYRLLDLADLVSLAACNRWREPFARHGMAGRYADGTVRLDPFPLAGTTAFALPCRHIPNRPYRGDADLGGELAAARWQRLEVRVAAG